MHTHILLLQFLWKTQTNTGLKWKAHICLSLCSDLDMEAGTWYQQKDTGCLCWCQRATLPWRQKASPNGDECGALWTGTMMSGQTIRAQANLAFCPHISCVDNREGQVWMSIHMNSCFSFLSRPRVLIVEKRCGDGPSMLLVLHTGCCIQRGQRGLSFW